MALYIIDNFDREPEASTDFLFADAEANKCPGFEDKPGKRIPKAKAKAEAGIGRAKAAVGVLEVEAKGPNVKAEAEASLRKLSAMAGAELGSVSGKAGPFDAKLGLGIKTGASIGIDGVEVKLLNIGLTATHRGMSVSLYGIEVGFSWL